MPARLPPSRSVMTPAAEAVGRVARGYLWAYPPGIPLAVPGEELTADLAETIRRLEGAGGKLVGMGPGGTVDVVA